MTKGLLWVLGLWVLVLIAIGIVAAVVKAWGYGLFN